MPDDTSDGGDEETPAPFDADSAEGSGRPIGDLFETVSDRRARYVLAHLESLSVDVVDLEDVAEYVAQRERAAERETESNPSDDSVGQGSGDDAGSGVDVERHCHRVAVALHHNHLPKLDAVAVLDYDPRSRTLRYWGDVRVATVLDLLEASENR
ncbi:MULTISPECIES: hypothetical protein [Halorussus]|uniref:DUF7344 domain-containing protein n=1 Tax=Halorussus TaxID=1070314 RepID=UPI000E215FB3|nr:MULTISPECIES: hypothetical protein [Halorussus]NHN61449.1 hypothetical protein [Halorussus sp. JP-T4]